eukprot:TRINITY_DN4500_c0_g1_i1.p1 TRINITY_DN4500_c0_g1~~TRINITY_DN4500_c0_g1_i1.p1  ORF type:complete len:355 (-),score=72.19 TRINITY_DN4500_c0_g1_i1:13-1077(-)
MRTSLIAVALAALLILLVVDSASAQTTCKINTCNSCVPTTEAEPTGCDSLTYAEKVEEDCTMLCSNCTYDSLEAECDFVPKDAANYNTCYSDCQTSAPPAPPGGNSCRVNKCKECVVDNSIDPTTCPTDSPAEEAEKVCDEQCTTCAFSASEQECDQIKDANYQTCYNTCISSTPVADYCDLRGCDFDQCSLVTSTTPAEQCQPPTTSTGLCNEECKEHRVCTGSSNCAFTTPNTNFDTCHQNCMANPPLPEPCIITGCEFDTCQKYTDPYDDSSCTAPTTQTLICRQECKSELDCDLTASNTCAFETSSDYTSCHTECMNLATSSGPGSSQSSTGSAVGSGFITLLIAAIALF